MLVGFWNREKSTFESDVYLSHSISTAFSLTIQNAFEKECTTQRSAENPTRFYCK